MKETGMGLAGWLEKSVLTPCRALCKLVVRRVGGEASGVQGYGGRMAAR